MAHRHLACGKPVALVGSYSVPSIHPSPVSRWTWGVRAVEGSAIEVDLASGRVEAVAGRESRVVGGGASM